MISDTWFVQYWSDDPWVVLGKNDPPAIHFHNGFSSAYHKLKHMGDFMWLKQGQKLPFTRGNIYVSLMYPDAVDSIVETARENPDLKIHLGGPLLSVNNINTGADVPNLITYPQMMVEEVLGIQYDPKNWGLDLPMLPVGQGIAYNYGAINGTGCPWAKCTFCKCQKSTHNYEELSRLRNPVPVIHHDGFKYVWIRSASMEPSFLKCMPKKPDTMYCNYLRGDWVNYGKLVHAPLHDGMLFSMGVEIPSNRMLRKVKKGSTTSSMKQTIKFLDASGCRVHINLMLGFNNFKWEDVNEVGMFLDDLSKDVDLSKITATIYHLIIVPGREIFENPPGPLERYDSYKSCLDLGGIYKCVLDDKQRAMNDMIHQLYYESGLQINNDRYEGGK